jgi:hypothetical protein
LKSTRPWLRTMALSAARSAWRPRCASGSAPT